MKKAFAIFFALIILTTNVAATFTTHYCGGKALKTSISLGNDNLDCGMANMDTPCENYSKSPIVKRKNCCENHYVKLKTDNSFNTPSIIKKSVDFNFVFDFVFTPIKLYSFNASTEVDF